MVMPISRARSLMWLLWLPSTLPLRLAHRAGATFTGVLSTASTLACTPALMFLCPLETRKRYPYEMPTLSARSCMVMPISRARSLMKLLSVVTTSRRL